MTRFNRTLIKTARAQRLRREATPAERKLWAHLRESQMNDASFRRQHPVGPYILDFYCPDAKLAVELDGDQHGNEEGVAYDAARTRFLNSKGIRVIRFANHELKQNFDGVREGIQRALQRTPTLPSPFQGEAEQFSMNER